MAVQLADEADGCILPVYVTPRAGRTEIAGERDGALWLRLAAPPVEGAANDELLDFLARQLDVPRRALAIVAGAGSRHKRVRIAGLTPPAVHQRLWRA